MTINISEMKFEVGDHIQWEQKGLWNDRDYPIATGRVMVVSEVADYETHYMIGCIENHYVVGGHADGTYVMGPNMIILEHNELELNSHYYDGRTRKEEI